MTFFRKERRVGIRVLVLSKFFPPAYLAGGPIRTLEAAIRRSVTPGQYWVMTSNSDLGARGSLRVQTGRWESWWGSHVWYQDNKRLFSIVRSLFAEARLRPDVVYLNSLWGVRYAGMYLLLHRLGVVRSILVLAPRGQLSRSALAIKPTKKKFVLKVINSLGLTRGVVIQASSEREVSDARRALGSSATFIVSSNDILTKAVDPSSVKRTGPTLRLVYVGRIAHIKGVHLLLRALGDLDPAVRMRADIYGEALDADYRNECLSLAARVGSRVQVTFHGPVPYEQVPSLFAKADLFVLPTASENFGHVIAEAMANGCPVAAPDTTPWSPVICDGGGWLLPDNSVSNISAVVRMVAALPVEDRHVAKVEAVGAYRRWEESDNGGGLDRLVAQLSLPDDSDPAP